MHILDDLNPIGRPPAASNAHHFLLRISSDRKRYRENRCPINLQFLHFQKIKKKCSFRMWREAAEWWQIYERQSLLEYCIDGAIIEMHSSNDDTFKNGVCWRTAIEIVRSPHRVSRSASAHCRRPWQWHHRSSSGVEDINPIRKTCDFMKIHSSKNEGVTSRNGGSSVFKVSINFY